MFLASAEEDLKDIRRYVVKRFGKETWQETLEKIKVSIHSIETFPQGGSIPDELTDLGVQQYRQVISDMNRVIYEIREEVIYIHVVCDVRRDLTALLARRLLRAFP